MATASARQQRDEKVVRAVACPHCGRPAGEWCRTRRGYLADRPHGRRLRSADAREPVDLMQRLMDSLPPAPTEGETHG